MKKVSVLVFTLLFLASGFVGVMGFGPTIEVASAAGGSFGGGNGTVGNPYLIEDVEDLQAMNNNRGAHYALANDIDATNTSGWNLGTGFISIGTDNNRFTGSLDGRNYTITNLYIQRPNIDYVGLFGYTGYGCEVKNIHLNNSDITGKEYVGGLIGLNVGGTIGKTSMSGTVTGQNYVGGIIGWNDDGVLTESYANGYISGNNNIGGLVGITLGGVVNNSYANGTTTGNYQVGGLIGQSFDGVVNNCHAAGTTDGTEDNVGGLIGLNNGYVSESYATGITAGNNDVGGLIGRNDGSVNNSYATGLVTRNSGTETSFGGFVGRNNQGKIINCYSTGRVIYAGATNPTNKGFAGSVDTGGSYEMSGNFWDTNASLQNSTAGNATGKSTGDMRTLATFENVGWDIVPIQTYVGETWFIDQNNDYPRLGFEHEYVQPQTPTANAGSDRTVTQGTVVYFDGSNSTDNVGITNYTWSFNDLVDIVLYSVSPSYQFINAGIYVVTLNVSDAIGNWDIDNMNVTVIDTQPPIADAGSDRTVTQGTVVSFDGSNSSDNIGIVNYTWTFNDGLENVVLYGVSHSHVFMVPGTFVVTLNVTDATGNWDMDTMNVVVLPGILLRSTTGIQIFCIPDDVIGVVDTALKLAQDIESKTSMQVLIISQYDNRWVDFFYRKSDGDLFTSFHDKNNFDLEIGRGYLLYLRYPGVGDDFVWETTWDGADAPVTVSLKLGFNIVGVPYTNPVSPIYDMGYDVVDGVNITNAFAWVNDVWYSYLDVGSFDVQAQCASSPTSTPMQVFEKTANAHAFFVRSTQAHTWNQGA